MKIIIKEFIEWIETIMGFFPGKVGTLIRMIWYRFRWEKAAYVRIRTHSQFLSPKNIHFCGKASLGKFAFFSADGGYIEIGDNFFSNNNLHMNASVNGKIIIGENVLFGPNVVLRTASHNFAANGKLIKDQGHSFGNINIEDNVWIGANCIILPNVVIGEGSVVAAGALVNKSVSAFTLVGGVPAKTIKNLKK